MLQLEPADQVESRDETPYIDYRVSMAPGTWPRFPLDHDEVDKKATGNHIRQTTNDMLKL